MAFNWTQIVVSIIGLVAVVMSALLTWAWKNYIHPWLDERGLTEAAETVVYAAETILGRYCGEDKWNLALQKLKNLGFDVDTDEVKDAVRAAWQKLNLSQIASGEKEVSDANASE